MLHWNCFPSAHIVITEVSPKRDFGQASRARECTVGKEVTMTLGALSPQDRVLISLWT